MTGTRIGIRTFTIRVVVCVLLHRYVLLGGCSDSLTGVTPPTAEEDVTVQEAAEHNTNGTDTNPGASHNTSDQD